MDFTQLKRISELKIVWVAIVLAIIFGKLVHDEMVSTAGIITAFISMSLIVYIIEQQFRYSDIKSHFIIGIFSYYGYVFVMYFLKIATQPLDIAGEVITGVLFGAICAGIYLINTKILDNN